jgi:hypothetical protein
MSVKVRVNDHAGTRSCILAADGLAGKPWTLRPLLLRELPAGGGELARRVHPVT